MNENWNWNWNGNGNGNGMEWNGMNERTNERMNDGDDLDDEWLNDE